MAIASLADVKAALGITTTDSDAQLTALLEPVTAAIERYAGRAFEASVSYTEDHMGGDPVLNLRERPVDSITSVTDLVTGEVLDSSLYEIDGRLGLLTRLPRGNQWASGRLHLEFPLHERPKHLRWRVVYVAGEVPEDVKLAFYEALQSQITSQGGFTSEKDGDYAYTRASGGAGATSALPSTSLELLKRFNSEVFI